MLTIALLIACSAPQPATGASGPPPVDADTEDAPAVAEPCPYDPQMFRLIGFLGSASTPSEARPLADPTVVPFGLGISAFVTDVIREVPRGFVQLDFRVSAPIRETVLTARAQGRTGYQSVFEYTYTPWQFESVSGQRDYILPDQACSWTGDLQFEWTDRDAPQCVGRQTVAVELTYREGGGPPHCHDLQPDWGPDGPIVEDTDPP